MSGLQPGGLQPGVWAASLTPVNQDLSIDHGALAAHVTALLADGCDGVVALGTTGEANSFSVRERLELIAALGARSYGAERIVIGTGCCAMAETVELTRAALGAGFTHVLMLPPFYYKNVTDDGLFAAYARTIDAVNDSALRAIIYDIPPQTGFSLSNALLRRLRDAFPETVVGVKNSSGDWSAMEATLRELPGFGVFAGSEQFLLPALRGGGPGCISAMANVTAPQLAPLYAAWRNDGADALQARAVEVRQALQPFPTIAALKEIMALRTTHDGWRRVRPPLVALSDAQREAVAVTARKLALV